MIERNIWNGTLQYSHQNQTGDWRRTCPTIRNNGNKRSNYISCTRTTGTTRFCNFYHFRTPYFHHFKSARGKVHIANISICCTGRWLKVAESWKLQVPKFLIVSCAQSGILFEVKVGLFRFRRCAKWSSLLLIISINDFLCFVDSFRSRFLNTSNCPCKFSLKLQICVARLTVYNVVQISP